MTSAECHKFGFFCGVSLKQICQQRISSVEPGANPPFGYLPGENADKYKRLCDNMHEYVGARYCA